jgi:CubicO group peptidase (beta-lactamase class C family)
VDPDIDAMARAQIDPDGPGAGLAVIHRGRLLHCQGYGLANLEWRQPIRRSTVLCVGSVTKPFTAAAIMRLEREGQIDLTAPVRAYLPEWSHTPWAEVTIANLLSHTSGIKNYVFADGFWERVAPRDQSPAELIATIAADPLDFEPGTRYGYSNSNYCLLGMIIETLSGMDYGTFMEQNVFEPLGMHASRYLAPGRIIRRRADGYEVRDGENRQAGHMSMSVAYAAGGLGSTLDDLIRWDAALRCLSFLDEETQRRMYKPFPLLDGRSQDYGLGWAITHYRARHAVHHAGGVPGFSAFVARYLDDDLTVIVLSNRHGFNAAGLARPIVDHVLQTTPPSVQPVAVPPEEIAAVVGTYRDGPTTLEVTETALGARTEGALVADLTPLGVGRFFNSADPDVVVQFEDRRGDLFHRVTVTLPFYWYTLERAGGGGHTAAR